MKTMKQLAADALAVQDASNLSGVARSFVDVVDQIRTLTPNTTEWKRHPILKLWSDKIASLTGTQFEWDSLAAYNEVERLANGEDTRPRIVIRDEAEFEIDTAYNVESAVSVLYGDLSTHNGHARHITCDPQFMAALAYEAKINADCYGIPVDVIKSA